VKLQLIFVDILDIAVFKYSFVIQIGYMLLSIFVFSQAEG